ncbi:MAG: AAA family ATPase [Synergistaceae bacterium]|nr:AAA family ATPase [Synergistaceae bacterium]
MDQRWTLHFRKLGLIEEGSVRIAPLMVFTGDNNSGKSYAMTLLWGVVALGRDLFPSAVPESEAYRQCEAWLLARAQEGADEVVLDEASMDLFVRWFGDNLNQKKQILCDELFGKGKIRLKELRISDYARGKPFSLKWDRQALEGSRYSTNKKGSRRDAFVRFPLLGKESPRSERYGMIKYLTWNLLMGDLSAPLFPARLSAESVPGGEILYLPAARTGFMLMRKVLAATLVSLGKEALPLTLPTRRFVQRLLNLSFKENGRYGPFADLLESRIFQGRVRPDASPLPEYHYSPREEDGTALPLWLTSSLVTELSPLLLFLRSGEDFRSLIIEEPEAHLHLKMQMELARLLARLVNAGLPVWVTTHGDSFFQQLSNLVKASAFTKEQLASVNMDSEESLSPEQVAAWHFRRSLSPANQERTEVISLAVDEGGIAGAAFNAGLAGLTKETLALEELADDGHED